MEPGAFGTAGKIASEKMGHLKDLAEDPSGMSRELRKVLGDKPHYSYDEGGGAFSAASESSMRGESRWEPIEDFLKDMGLEGDREVNAAGIRDVLASMKELSTNPAERVYAAKMLDYIAKNPSVGETRLGMWRGTPGFDMNVKSLSDDGTIQSRHIAHQGAGDLLTRELGSRKSPLIAERPLKGLEDPMYGLREFVEPHGGLPGVKRQK
jgi:hypothetical protein